MFLWLRDEDLQEHHQAISKFLLEVFTDKYGGILSNSNEKTNTKTEIPLFQVLLDLNGAHPLIDDVILKILQSHPEFVSL